MSGLCFVFIIVITLMFFFFFFQAEDGIRDRTVTGVQTCALPILIPSRSRCGGRSCSRVQTREYCQVGGGSFSSHSCSSYRRHFTWHSLTSPSAAARLQPPATNSAPISAFAKAAS